MVFTFQFVCDQVDMLDDKEGTNISETELHDDRSSLMSIVEVRHLLSEMNDYRVESLNSSDSALLNVDGDIKHPRPSCSLRTNDPLRGNQMVPQKRGIYEVGSQVRT